MLTAADLSYMQDTQKTAMPGTVVVERVALVSDGMGGQEETWTAVGTVMGRIYPMIARGQTELIGGAQVLSQTQWWGTLPEGTIVYANDRLVYGGSTWEILRVNNDEMYQTAVRCELEKFNEIRRV